MHKDNFTPVSLSEPMTLSDFIFSRVEKFLIVEQVSYRQLHHLKAGMGDATWELHFVSSLNNLKTAGLHGTFHFPECDCLCSLGEVSYASADFKGFLRSVLFFNILTLFILDLLLLCVLNVFPAGMYVHHRSV